VQLTVSDSQLFLADKPVDFRRSIDRLSVIVLEALEGQPIEGSIFVFYNNARNKLKILGWHRNGFALIYKRLEPKRFTVLDSENGCVTLSSEQLSWLCVYSHAKLRELTTFLRVIFNCPRW
jgi:transposase